MKVSENNKSVQNELKTTSNQEFVSIGKSSRVYFFDFRKNDITDYVVIAPNKQRAISMLVDAGKDANKYKIVNDGLALRSNGEFFSMSVNKL